MRLEAHLDAVARGAIEAALGTPAAALLKPAKDPAHGDYQVNGVMPLAKQLGKAPRELALPVAELLRADPAIAKAEVAGPGFINITLEPRWLAELLGKAGADRARDGVPAVEQPERVVVDFSGPNIAKEMHVGHLRSTIIGDALCRMLRFVGHTVISDNHLGDWGTQFGLLIVGMRRFGDPAALDAQPVQELERVYKLSSAAAKEDPQVAAEARAELAKLQQGDPENRALWQRFIAATRTELDRIYARLEVHFDEWLGESSYEDALPGVVERLLKEGIAREDQGAICVFFEDDPELSKQNTPFIVRKQDGAYLYSTTDIATALHRKQVFGAQRALIVVDQRQQLHFKQLFATMKRLGVDMAMAHIGFGSVLGADGKPLKTRDGQTIKLAALLDEAEQRAAQRMRDEGIEVEPERMPELARQVGMGAVKYADLSQNRLSDYKFDWDKLISFKGNAGPYLQYAHARVSAIFRKGEIDVQSLTGVVPTLEHPAELALGRQLVRFADVVHAATDSYLPHLICDHLYALAREFSGFYEQCPVLKAEGDVRNSRLLLVWLTARQLARGLALLGISAPERM